MKIRKMIIILIFLCVLRGCLVSLCLKNFLPKKQLFELEYFVFETDTIALSDGISQVAKENNSEPGFQSK
jgi:hypothetical protein